MLVCFVFFFIVIVSKSNNLVSILRKKHGIMKRQLTELEAKSSVRQVVLEKSKKLKQIEKHQLAALNKKVILSRLSNYHKT